MLSWLQLASSRSEKSGSSENLKFRSPSFVDSRELRVTTVDRPSSLCSCLPLFPFPLRNLEGKLNSIWNSTKQKGKQK